MARIFKVAINEFAIGMGPKIVSFTSKKTGIAYSIRLFPIGGFVSMVGEDEESDNENAFHKKALWKRFLITFAGPAVNVVIGILAMTLCIAAGNNIRTTQIDKLYLSDEEAYFAEENSFRVGDEIVEVDGRRVHIANEVSYEVMRNGIEPLDVKVIRDGETITLHNVTFPIREEKGTKLAAMFFDFKTCDKTFGTVMKESFYQSGNTIKMIWETLFDLLRGRYSINAVSGPVGATEVLVETGKTSGFLNFLYLGAVISINLGIMNLLPLPALDGGRILFLLIEAVRRKPMKMEVEGYINFAGLVLLLMFSAFIIIKDVIGLFN